MGLKLSLMMSTWKQTSNAVNPMRPPVSTNVGGGNMGVADPPSPRASLHVATPLPVELETMLADLAVALAGKQGKI